MFFLKPKAWRHRRAPIFSYSGPSRDLSEPIKDENNNEGVGEKREHNSKFSHVVCPNMIAVINRDCSYTTCALQRPVSRVTGDMDLDIAEDLRTSETVVRARLRPQIQRVRKPTSEGQANQKPKSPPPIMPDSHNQHDCPSSRKK